MPQSSAGYQPGNSRRAFPPGGVTEALQKSPNVPAVEVLDRPWSAFVLVAARRAEARSAVAPEPNFGDPRRVAVNLEGMVGAHGVCAVAWPAGRAYE